MAHFESLWNNCWGCFFPPLEGCSWQYLLEHLFRAHPGSQSRSPGKWFQAVLLSMGLPAKNSLKNLWHSIAGHSYVDDVVIVFVLVPSSYISVSWSQTKIQPTLIALILNSSNQGSLASFLRLWSCSERKDPNIFWHLLSMSPFKGKFFSFFQYII